MARRRWAQPSGRQGAAVAMLAPPAPATRRRPSPPRAKRRPRRGSASVYATRLDPALRADPSGRADALPALLDKATVEKLTTEEAALLAAALRWHEPWLAWAIKPETAGIAVDPVALHIQSFPPRSFAL